MTTGTPTLQQAESNAQPPAECGFWRSLSTRNRLILIGLGILLAVGLFWMLPIGAWVVAAYTWIQGLGYWAFATYIVIFALLSAVCLPTSPLNVGAGLLFGLWWGFLAALAGVMAASIGCFVLARYVARKWVRRRVGKSRRFQAVLKGLHTESWQLILLTRLNPILPAAIASYCFGVTPIRFWQYAAASLIGNIPLCFLLAYLGSVGQLAINRREWSVWDYVLYGVGLLATIAVTVWLTRFTRRKLASIADGSPAAEDHVE